MKNLQLAKLEDQHKRSVIQVGPVRIGEDFCLMAGPCSVESERQTLEIAEKVKAAGASMLRGGAFEARVAR